MTQEIDDKESIEKIKEKFLKMSDWEERYTTLIKWGKELPKLQDEFKLEELKVKGCQSQVWLKAERKESGNIIFRGESDSLIVQGLLALLIKVYSGKKPSEILELSPTFLEDLGLKKHLTPNRANGVYAMVKQMFYYAQAFKILET